jgi:beta-glucanase (GH16 family)
MKLCGGCVALGGAIVVMLACAGAQDSTDRVPAPTAPAGAGEWRLVWSDEFETAGLPDASKWTYDVGGNGWGNNELQYYGEGRSENARIEGGVLVIEARREPLGGRAYSSARLKTRAGWTYGRIEVRARLPRGRGTWPAIWMLPQKGTYGQGGWPDNGEIDIMEHVGFDPEIVHASVHTRAYNHVDRTQRTAQTPVPGAQDDFHRYAVEWTTERIRGFVDGREYFGFANERVSNAQADWRQWPFDRDFHILLNIAVGGNWGGQKGVDDSIWPQRMEIDYVRVMQVK